MFPQDFFEQIEKATLAFTRSIMLSFHQDIKRFKLMKVKDYTEDEVYVAKKYYNSTHLKYKSINEFNKWRKESIPLIAYKPSIPLIAYKPEFNENEEIEDVEIIG